MARKQKPPSQRVEKEPKDDGRLRFISTGCTPLDCVLAHVGPPDKNTGLVSKIVPGWGGWPLGRVSNVYGDTSVGKTLQAIEACANFAKQYPKGHIWYREAEAAFDLGYAQVVGLPEKRVNFGPKGADTQWNSIEEVFEDFGDAVKLAIKSRQPGLYVVDSLDGLASEEQLGRDIRKGTYNLGKQRLLSEMFQDFKWQARDAGIHLMFISQVRERIEAFVRGDKLRRSGGKSLDFYSSHILQLKRLRDIPRTEKGIKRSTGIGIKALCRKNKISCPQRECTFELLYSYGVDDYEACLFWLAENKQLGQLGITHAEAERWHKQDCDDKTHAERLAKLQAATRQGWLEVENSFLPKRRKYEAA